MIIVNFTKNVGKVVKINKKGSFGDWFKLGLIGAGLMLLYMMYLMVVKWLTSKGLGKMFGK